MEANNGEKRCLPTSMISEFSDSYRNLSSSIKQQQQRANGDEGKGTSSVYGCQIENKHIFYTTTSKDYGWYPPDQNTVPTVYYPKRQTFSSQLAAAGMYRNHSLNTNKDPQ